MNIFLNIFPVQIFNIKRCCKISTEIMRSTCLYCTSILHHRFNRISIYCPGKLLGRSLLTDDNRNRQIIFYEVTVNFQHTHRFFASFCFILMSGMAFLPQKLTSAQEWQSTFFPTNNVSPLINQNRQITIGLNPFLVHMTDHRLRGRTDCKSFFKLLASRFSHPR
ncbi:hypothetical protein D1872_252700 [compost metagenome]